MLGLGVLGRCPQYRPEVASPVLGPFQSVTECSVVTRPLSLPRAGLVSQHPAS